MEVSRYLAFIFIFSPLVLYTEEWEMYRASPRLKDAQLPEDRIRDLYIELLVTLRTIFHRCRLVHADFSEYNILFVPAFLSYMTQN